MMQPMFHEAYRAHYTHGWIYQDMRRETISDIIEILYEEAKTQKD
jgi:hypothetical protein